jgi:hypothetical protein
MTKRIFSVIDAISLGIVALNAKKKAPSKVHDKLIMQRKRTL